MLRRLTLEKLVRGSFSFFALLSCCCRCCTQFYCKWTHTRTPNIKRNITHRKTDKYTDRQRYTNSRTFACMHGGTRRFKPSDSINNHVVRRVYAAWTPPHVRRLRRLTVAKSWKKKEEKKTQLLSGCDVVVVVVADGNETRVDNVERPPSFNKMCLCLLMPLPAAVLRAEHETPLLRTVCARWRARDFAHSNG